LNNSEEFGSLNADAEFCGGQVFTPVTQKFAVRLENPCELSSIEDSIDSIFIESAKGSRKPSTKR
jgi:hypothetical protein